MSNMPILIADFQKCETEDSLDGISRFFWSHVYLDQLMHTKNLVQIYPLLGSLSWIFGKL